jgi:hypothetical protein
MARLLGCQLPGSVAGSQMRLGPTSLSYRKALCRKAIKTLDAEYLVEIIINLSGAGMEQIGGLTFNLRMMWLKPLNFLLENDICEIVTLPTIPLYRKDVD